MKNKKINPYLFSILTIFLFSIDCYSQNQVSPEIKQTIIKNGVGLGGVIAITASWERNKSILWAILHGLFSWIYVIYYAFTRESNQ